MKRLLIVGTCVLLALSPAVVLANDEVKIIAVSEATWKIEKSNGKKEGTTGGGAAAGAVGGLWLLGGPIGLGLGIWAGNHVEKEVAGQKNSSNTSSEVVHGYRIKLNNGEPSIKTIVKYKVGQKLRRSEIAEEL